MKNKKSSKKGFSLLEVMLAIAIMLVASTMILEGFLTTLAYSANTALYAQCGGHNSKQMYEAVSTRTGKNGDGGAVSITEDGKRFSGTPGTLEMSGGMGTVKYRVNSWKSSNTLTTFDGEPSNNSSFNRYAVTYCMPDITCPYCHKKDHLAISAKTYRWMCTACSSYIPESSST